ncbi:MAG: hypothetical protein EOR99_10915, partial [Mesorhizobium sp.]
TNGRCVLPAKRRPLWKYALWSNPISRGSRAEDDVLCRLANVFVFTQFRTENRYALFLELL